LLLARSSQPSEQSLVACTTTTAASHLLFSQRRFDYALLLVDGLNVTQAIGAILPADRFIMLNPDGQGGSNPDDQGDKYSAVALFRRLANTSPSASCRL